MRRQQPSSASPTPVVAPPAILTRQTKKASVHVVNVDSPCRIVYAGRREHFHCSGALPFRPSDVHSMISISKAGTLRRHGGGRMEFTRDESPADSVDRFVGMCQASSRRRGGKLALVVLPIPNSPSSRVRLSFGLRDLPFRPQHTHGQVYRISITFVIFVPGTVKKCNIATSFLLCRCRGNPAKGNSASVMAVSAVELPASLWERGVVVGVGSESVRPRPLVSVVGLPASLWERGFVGGENLSLELRPIEEIPGEFVELGKSEKALFESDLEGLLAVIRMEGGLDGIEVFAEEGGLDSEDEELSQSLSRFPANYGRELLSMSYVHSESQSLWPVPVAVSSPKGNFTMRTTESGGVIPMIRSTNVCSVTPLDDGTGRSVFVDHSKTTLHGENGFAESRIVSSDLFLGNPCPLEHRERMFVVRYPSDGCRRTPSQKWTLKEIVGIGGFLIVFAARRERTTGSLFGSYVCKTSKPESGVYGREMLLHEGKVLNERQQLVDSFLLNGRLHLVMESLERLELWSEQDFVMNPLHPIEKLYALEKLSWAIFRNLHSGGIAHCDLKPNNLLVSRGSTSVRICDFGMAVNWKKVEQARGGTVGYMPPSLEGDPRKIDVYSFGIIAWELWTGKRAFQKERDQFLRRNTSEEESIGALVLQFLAATRGKTPDLNCPEISSLPEELRSLLSRCWAEDPEERPLMQVVHEQLSELHLEALQELLISGDAKSRRNRFGSLLRFSLAERIVGELVRGNVTLLRQLLNRGQLQLVMNLLSEMGKEEPEVLHSISGLSDFSVPPRDVDETPVDSFQIVQGRLRVYRTKRWDQAYPPWFPVPSDVSQALREAAEALRSDSLTPFGAFSVGMAVCAFSLVEYAQENCAELVRDLLEKSEVLCQKGRVSESFDVFVALSQNPLRCVRRWCGFLCAKRLQEAMCKRYFDVLSFFKDLFDALEERSILAEQGEGDD